MTREEAIGRIQEHRRIHSKKEPFTPKLDEAFDMAIEALKRENGTPYDVERPHGEWIKKYNVEDPTTVCSVCGFDTEDQVYFNFCPNCGSDNRPKIHGCSFADETCKKNPCADCGVKDEAIDGEGKDGNVKEGEAE